MTSSIKTVLLEDMKAAMRAQEKERLGTIRLILAAVKQREVDERIELTDDDLIVTLNKMIKQRRDSISQYEAGGRPELAKKEADEILIIQTYLPPQLSEADLDRIVTETIQACGVVTPKDMGKVMGVLKEKLFGKADMSVVSNKVKMHLAGK